MKGLPAVEIMFPLRNQADDAANDQSDPLVQIFDDMRAAFTRDKDNVFHRYFVNSPINHVMDAAGTVPKGDDIPTESQLPPVPSFFDKKHMTVSLALSNQVEHEHHERSHAELASHKDKFRVQLIPDMTSRDQAGRVRTFLATINTANYPDEAHLLPRPDDSFKLVLKDMYVETNEAVPKTLDDDAIVSSIMYIFKEAHTKCVDLEDEDEAAAEAAQEEHLVSELNQLYPSAANEPATKMTPFIAELKALDLSVDPRADLRAWVDEHKDLGLGPRADEMTNVDPVTNPLIVTAVFVSIPSSSRASKCISTHSTCPGTQRPKTPPRGTIFKPGTRSSTTRVGWKQTIARSMPTSTTTV